MSPLRTTSVLLLATALVACGEDADPIPSGQGGADAGATTTPLAATPAQATERAPMPTARDGHTATLLADGRVVVIGGEAIVPSREMLDTVELYDPQTDLWTELAPLPESRCNHTATLLADGTILVVGGGRSNAIGAPSGLDVRAEALLFDPVADRWESLGPNLVPRHGHRAARLPSGKVLIVGGAGDDSTVKPSQGTSNPQPFGNALASTEIYDPVARTFGASSPLAEPRWAFGAVALADGRILVSGGANYETEATSLATSEIFDEAVGAFTAAGAFAGSDRLFHTSSALADGRALVFGGKQANVAFLADAQIFEPTTATWTTGAELPPPRTVATSVPTAEGGALVIGGLSCSLAGCSVPPNVDVWHPDGTVTAGPTLHQGRGLATATVLADGSVLVVGGYSATTGLASVELLSP